MSSSALVGPQWLDQGRFLAVEFPQPPAVQKLLGGQAVDVDAAFERAYQDEVLDAVAESGVGVVFIPFFSGFGLEYEKEIREAAGDYIERAHKKQVRVAAVISAGALTPETLLLEESESHNWVQISQEGRDVRFPGDGETFRVRPCYNSEAYQRYLEKVCAEAVEFGADMIFFKDIGYRPEPDTCHCPICVAAFREMLRSRYGGQEEHTRELGLARFGHHTFTHVRPPAYTRGDAHIHPPVLSGVHQQEWARFKVLTICNYVERLSKVVRRRSPDCAVGAEVDTPAGENADWLYGLNMGRLAAHLDVVSRRTTSVPSIGTEPFAVIRAAKAALGVRTIFPVTTPSVHKDDRVLRHAQAMAFDPGGLGSLGVVGNDVAILGGGDSGECVASLAELKAFQDFWRVHREALFCGSRTVPQVALLREESSLTYNQRETHQVLNRVELSLIALGFPYEILPSTGLGDLSRFAAIILPYAECLSDELASELQSYVENGGGLLLIGQAGVYDDWRRRRPSAALAHLFGPAYPSPLQTEFGNGRAAFIFEPNYPVSPAESANGVFVRSGDIGEPQAAFELADALNYVGGRELASIRADSGSPIVEIRRNDSSAALVHVINPDRGSSIKGLRVALPMEHAPQSVQPLSPLEHYEAIPFEFDPQEKVLRFEFGELKRYVIFRVS